MMKSILPLFILFIMLNSNAQTSENENVKATVIEFFKAFHKQDTTALKTMAKGNIKMQSINVNREGKVILVDNDYYDFLKSIASISKNLKFEEKLLDFTIKVDGNMANVWTPYEFWYEDTLSHCGVNSFQLMKAEDKWVIIYLVDTRRREGCQK